MRVLTIFTLLMSFFISQNVYSSKISGKIICKSKSVIEIDYDGKLIDEDTVSKEIYSYDLKIELDYFDDNSELVVMGLGGSPYPVFSMDLFDRNGSLKFYRNGSLLKIGKKMFSYEGDTSSLIVLSKYHMNPLRDSSNPTSLFGVYTNIIGSDTTVTIMKCDMDIDEINKLVR